MKNIDLDRINIILATDCGSTTTKAILLQQIDGQFRQTHRGAAPTPVEEPFADVTVGVVNSVTEVSELAGRRLVSDEMNLSFRDLINQKPIDISEIESGDVVSLIGDFNSSTIASG